MTDIIETQSSIEPEQVEPEKSKFRPKLIPMEKIKALRIRGFSYQEIAKQVGCNKSNIVNRLLHIKFDREELREVAKNLGAITLSDYMRYRSHITTDKLKKTPAVQLAQMVSFKYNEYRLESDQSTENVSVIQDIRTLDAEAKQEILNPKAKPEIKNKLKELAEGNKG